MAPSYHQPPSRLCQSRALPVLISACGCIGSYETSALPSAPPGCLLCAPYDQVQGTVERIRKWIAMRVQKLPQLSPEGASSTAHDIFPYVDSPPTLLWHPLHRGTRSSPAPVGHLTPLRLAGASHNCLSTHICRETPIYCLHIGRQCSNPPHLCVTERLQPCCAGLPSGSCCQMLFSRPVVPKRFPDCGAGRFLGGKCHPVAKCEILTASHLQTQKPPQTSKI